MRVDEENRIGKVYSRRRKNDTEEVEAGKK
jgi:hypothetical protein